MPYEYQLIVDGVQRRLTRNHFKQNIIAKIVSDLEFVNPKTDEVIFKVIKY